MLSRHAVRVDVLRLRTPNWKTKATPKTDAMENYCIQHLPQTLHKATNIHLPIRVGGMRREPEKFFAGLSRHGLFHSQRLLLETGRGRKVIQYAAIFVVNGRVGIHSVQKTCFSIQKS